MAVLYWYIVRLERLAASWLFRQQADKIPGKVPSTIFTDQQNFFKRFHTAATGG
ncbi:MAG: hypothetical protein IJP78_07660 [Clostridia bacterium]|nr:hypothetical protein [Clostridia bacterium]